MRYLLNLIKYYRLVMKWKLEHLHILVLPLSSVKPSIHRQDKGKYPTFRTTGVVYYHSPVSNYYHYDCHDLAGKYALGTPEKTLREELDAEIRFNQKKVLTRELAVHLLACPIHPKHLRSPYALNFLARMNGKCHSNP